MKTRLEFSGIVDGSVVALRCEVMPVCRGSDCLLVGEETTLTLGQYRRLKKFGKSLYVTVRRSGERFYRRVVRDGLHLYWAW